MTCNTLNNNAVSAPSPITGALHRLVGADGASTRYEVDSFGSNSAFNMVRANGTCASPTALVAGNNMGQVAAFGHDGSAYSGGKAGLRTYANENWASGANGTRVTLWSTPNGSSTQADNISVDSTGLDLLTGSYKVAGTVGFTGTGAYTNFTIVGGIITAAS